MTHHQTDPADAERAGEVTTDNGSVVSTFALVLRDRFGPDADAVAERQLDAATEGTSVVWSAILAELAHSSSPM